MRKLILATTAALVMTASAQAEDYSSAEIEMKLRHGIEMFAESLVPFDVCGNRSGSDGIIRSLEEVMVDTAGHKLAAHYMSQLKMQRARYGLSKIGKCAEVAAHMDDYSDMHKEGAAQVMDGLLMLNGIDPETVNQE